MVSDHPLVRETEIRKNLGRLEAEQYVRTVAAGAIPEEAPGHKAACVKAVAEIDEGRKAAKADALAGNKEMAARLGLSLDQAGDLVGKLAADPALETWLVRRVNLTRAGDAPLAHDEHSDNA